MQTLVPGQPSDDSLHPLTTVSDPPLQDTEMTDNCDREDVSPFSDRELKTSKIQAAHKMIVKRWYDSLGHLHSWQFEPQFKENGNSCTTLD